jgi:hypothetical protein
MKDGESLKRRSFELLEAVHDRSSFLEFLWAFVEEREAAESLEREFPQYLRWSARLAELLDQFLPRCRSGFVRGGSLQRRSAVLARPSDVSLLR